MHEHDTCTVCRYMCIIARNQPLINLQRLKMVSFHREANVSVINILCSFSVSERAQHNFDESMKEGELGYRSGNSFLMGAGGSGKTHVLHAFLKEKPPPIRQSTQCVKNPVRAVAQCKLGVSKKTAGETRFTRITDQQYSDMLCESAKHSQLSNRGRRSPQPHTRRLEGDEAAVAHISAGDFNVLPPVQDVESAIADITKKLEHSGLEKELVVRIQAGSKAAGQLDDQDVIDMGDSGGQPTYHEILPVFVSNTMFGMLVVKLNEPLDSHPLVEYYTNGKPIGKPFKSPFTHLQTFRHCMRVLQSTCESGKCPKIAFIGTHKDLEDECKGENRAEKERKLLSIIPPNMRDHVLFSDAKSQRLLFAINAKCPGGDDQAVLADLRYLMLRELQKLKRVRIPHRYFALEMAFKRIAKYHEKAILSKEECFKEATKFHFTRESFEDALQYLTAHKLVMHYSEVLPEVVFINSQVVLDKITELVEHSLTLRAKLPTQVQAARSVRGCKELEFCGIITRDILSQFKSGYISQLFEEDHLILLFEHLLIIAKVGEGKYLMSCLLEPEEGAIPHPLSLPAPLVATSLLFYFGPDGPKLGVYCCLLSTLITDSKWELLMEDGNPVQLSRNRARFTVPGKNPGFITITDSFTTFFHVEITFPSNISQAKALEVCEKVCPLIHETILTGIRKASRRLNYNNSIPDTAFLCSSAEHRDTALHAATISSSGLLTCTTHPASVFSEMTEEHKIWFGKDATFSCDTGMTLYCLLIISKIHLIFT